ncbi:MAG: FAD-binding oxidoreductase [Paludibacter sp.]|nr:FAD-binding oxidoreductase [Paludibacter sp.]
MTVKRVLFKEEVLSVKSIANEVFVLSFARDFEFRSGQVISLDLVADGQPRLYSIASGEKDNEIEILFDEKPDGRLTPLLSVLKPGDTIFVSEPFGTFQCDKQEAMWIAAGTGVAPFVSMLRSGLGQNKTLIHGARWDENFYFSQKIENMLHDKYIRCCSQQEDTAYFRGRLTEWLDSQTKLSIDIQYYLCGSAEMVVQVRDILIKKGIPFQNIISETYF